MSTPHIVAERARELLSYDPETGLLRRRIRMRGVTVGEIAGSKHIQGYICARVDGRTYPAHRIIWLIVHGVWPTGQIDHINGVRDDNRLANLRDATRNVNCQNLRGPRSDGTSGFLGVSVNGGKWRARIHIDGKERNLGNFQAPELAHAAYLEAKRSFHAGCTI